MLRHSKEEIILNLAKVLQRFIAFSNQIIFFLNEAFGGQTVYYAFFKN